MISDPKYELTAQNYLILYAQAVTELKEFIECVKTNRNPVSEVLEYNKMIIIDTLKNKNLLPVKNIDSLYYSLLEEIRAKYKKEYDEAKIFNSVYGDFLSLSYAVNGYVLPIQIKSYDKFSLTVTLFDKKNNKVEEQEYEYLIVGGWKVDQSYGLVGHGLTDYIYPVKESLGFDTIYATNSDSIIGFGPTVFKEILEGKRSFPALGVSTLTNIYYRLAPNFNLGVGLGINADFYPTTNVRYLTGLSFIFKDTRNRIGLNFGYAWGKYKKLSSEQQERDIIRGANTTPNIIDHFGGSLYLGISYQSQIFSFENTQKEKTVR